MTLTASGRRNRGRGSPGELSCSLVELLVDALERTDSKGTIELAVRAEGSEAIVAATGGGELRLPAQPS